MSLEGKRIDSMTLRIQRVRVVGLMVHRPRVRCWAKRTQHRITLSRQEQKPSVTVRVVEPHTHVAVHVIEPRTHVTVNGIMEHRPRVAVRVVEPHTQIAASLATRGAPRLWQAPDGYVYLRCDLHGRTSTPAGSRIIRNEMPGQCFVCRYIPAKKREVDA